MSLDPKRRQLLLIKQTILKSRDSLIDYARYMRPDPKTPWDLTASLYEVRPHHALVARELEALELGLTQRLILTMPPRSGKSLLATSTFIPWFLGRNPTWSTIMATYNSTFAGDFGRQVRDIIQNPRHAQVFPKALLDPRSTSANRMNTILGGQLTFVGRGGSLTGRGGHLLAIDDPIKDRKEADSSIIRNQMWDWFTQVFSTRAMMDDARTLITTCMTGDTPVLLPDGTERLLRDIRPRDHIATYDQGKIVTSRVLNWINHGPDQVFTLTTASAKEVKANARHPFLVRRPWGDEWVRVRDLKPGDEILRATGASGSASNAPKRAAKSLSPARAFALSTIRGSAGRLVSGPRPSRRKAARTSVFETAMASLWATMIGCWSSRAVAVQSAAACPLKGPQSTGKAASASITTTRQRRFADWFATLATGWSAGSRPKPNSGPQPITFGITVDRLTAIEPAGLEDVFDIEVERTENFIANSLVSHNTRWNGDDIVGRLTDPNNPHYSASEAKKWRVVNLPAFADHNDPLGRNPGEVLWPQRFSVSYLAGLRDQDARGFSALYQGNPAPDTGIFFGPSDIREYQSLDQIPDEIRYYGASDHAISMQQWADKTVLMIFGVDQNDDIWIRPETQMGKLPSPTQVEIMLNLVKKFRPLFWFAEKGHISKSLGPFLRKRMAEEKVFTSLFELQPVSDKQSRAQSIKGKMAAGRVHFPAWASWYPEVRNQILTFPAGTNDDFVDTLSMMGLGLAMQHTPRSSTQKQVVKPGTFGYLRQQSDADRRRVNLRQSAEGW